MFNQHVAVQWRQAGINTLPGVAFTAASSKRTEEMHRSKSQKGRRSEGRGWGRRWIQHVAGDNMQHSVGETPFLPSLLLTHPWHGRNVQIKETSEVRMWEGVAVGIREDRKKKKNAVLTLRQKRLCHYSQHYGMSVKCNVKNPLLVRERAQSLPVHW